MEDEEYDGVRNLEELEEEDEDEREEVDEVGSSLVPQPTCFQMREMKNRQQTLTK